MTKLLKDLLKKHRVKTIVPERSHMTLAELSTIEMKSKTILNIKPS